MQATDLDVQTHRQVQNSNIVQLRPMKMILQSPKMFAVTIVGLSRRHIVP